MEGQIEKEAEQFILDVSEGESREEDLLMAPKDMTVFEGSEERLEKAQGDARMVGAGDSLRKEIEILEAKKKDLLKVLAEEMKDLAAMAEIEEWLRNEQDGGQENDSLKLEMKSELQNIKDQSDENCLQVKELQNNLSQKDEQIRQLLTKLDEESVAKDAAQKALKELESKHLELKEDLEAEKAARNNAVETKRNFKEELGALKEQYYEKLKKVRATIEEAKGSLKAENSELANELKNLHWTLLRRLSDEKDNPEWEVAEKEDVLKQLRKIQREAGEARVDLDEVVAVAKEADKRLKGFMKDLGRTQEDLAKTMPGWRSDARETILFGKNWNLPSNHLVLFCIFIQFVISALAMYYKKPNGNQTTTNNTQLHPLN